MRLRRFFFASACVAFLTSLAKTDDARYDEQMDVNVKGVFFSVQAVLPLAINAASPDKPGDGTAVEPPLA